MSYIHLLTQSYLLRVTAVFFCIYESNAFIKSKLWHYLVFRNEASKNSLNPLIRPPLTYLSPFYHLLCLRQLFHTWTWTWTVFSFYDKIRDSLHISYSLQLILDKCHIEVCSYILLRHPFGRSKHCQKNRILVQSSL